MNKNVIIGIVLAIVALGGGGYLYWDDIVTLIPEEYRSYIPGYVAPAPPVEATDTATAQPADTPEAWQEKLVDVLNGIAEREAAWLFPGAPFGYETTVSKLSISYPEELKRVNIDASGSLKWARNDDWSELNWRAELKGEPALDLIATNVEDGQIQDAAGPHSFAGGHAAARLWYEATSPLWLVPTSHFGFKVTGVERGEDGRVTLTLQPEQRPENGFCAISEMVLVLHGDDNELAAYRLKMFVDGKLVTRFAEWERDGDNYRIRTDYGTLALKGERTPERMELGDENNTYIFTYAENALTGLSANVKHDGIEYTLELTEVKAVAEMPDFGTYAIGEAFKEPVSPADWFVDKFGLPNPDECPAPAEEAAAEAGEAGDSPSAEGEGAGEENAQANAGEDEAAEGEAAETEGEQPAETAQAARPTPAPAPAEAEEEEAPAPAPAPRPAPTPAPAPRPQPARPATATAAAPATGSATVARPAAPAPYTQAVTAYRGGNLRLAEQKLLQTLRQSPNHAGANYLLGYIYYTRGNYSVARTYLSRVWQSGRDRQLAVQAQQLLHRMGYPY